MTSIPWRNCWLSIVMNTLCPTSKFTRLGMIVDSGRVRGVIDSVAAQLVLRVPGLDGTQCRKNCAGDEDCRCEPVSQTVVLPAQVSDLLRSLLLRWQSNGLRASAACVCALGGTNHCLTVPRAGSWGGSIWAPWH
jgi:hypothetical protein